MTRGDLPAMRRLLESDPSLANARSETDARGTFPLTSRPRPGRRRRRGCAEYGADMSTTDLEERGPRPRLGGVFGRPDVVEGLQGRPSVPSQGNKHGLTPLGCALGGAEGRWRKFSNATIEDWRRAAKMIRARGGVE